MRYMKFSLLIMSSAILHGENSCIMPALFVKSLRNNPGDAIWQKALLSYISGELSVQRFWSLTHKFYPL